MTSEHTYRLAEAVRDAMREGRTLATLESCTGGLVASALTDVPGAGYLLGGAVAYSPESKTRFGVPRETISRFGLVSPQVALAMAEAATRWFGTDVGVGVTGIAGPENEEDGAAGSGFAAVYHRGGRAVSVALQVSRDDRRRAKAEMTDEALAFLLEELDRHRQQISDPIVEAWIGR